MQVARAAAARTLADLAEREAAPPAPEPAAQAQEPATRPPRPAAAKPTDPGLLFVRVTKVVRDCVALEAKLAAGTQTTTSLHRRDPRRATLQDAFRLVTKHHPDRIDLIRAATARLDEELAADPNQTADVPELLFAIADELGIDIDLATLPDEFLGFTPKAHHKVEDDDAPAPRATSPP
jgi:hypothetical protein